MEDEATYDEGFAQGYRDGYEQGEKAGAQRVMDTQVVMLRHKLAILAGSAAGFLDAMRTNDAGLSEICHLEDAIRQAKTP